MKSINNNTAGFSLTNPVKRPKLTFAQIAALKRAQVQNSKQFHKIHPNIAELKRRIIVSKKSLSKKPTHVPVIINPDKTIPVPIVTNPDNKVLNNDNNMIPSLSLPSISQIPQIVSIPIEPYPVSQIVQTSREQLEIKNVSNNSSTLISHPNSQLETKKIPIDYDKDTGMLIFPCPHCDAMITVGVNEVNCCIFRHGYFYNIVNGQVVLLQQMNPHTPKQECDRLKAENKIVGCGKPFRIDMENCTRYVRICDYI